MKSPAQAMQLRLRKVQVGILKESIERYRKAGNEEQARREEGFLRDLETWIASNS